MRRFVSCVAVLALGLTACSGDVTEADEPNPVAAEEPEDEPEPEPEPPTETRVEAAERRDAEAAEQREAEAAAGTYGSSRVLDRLHDLCDEGDREACGDLHREAPAGSEYQEFAADRDGVSAEVDAFMETPEAQDLLFKLAVGELSPSQLAALCDAHDLLEPERAYELFASVYGDDALPIEVFTGYFERRC